MATKYHLLKENEYEKGNSVGNSKEVHITREKTESSLKRNKPS